MEIPKPTGEDKARFQQLVPDEPDVEVKPMFGNLGAFVNGNMFMGLFGPAIGVKLPPDDLEQVMASGGAPFGPSERPMSGYVALPQSMDADEVRSVVSRSLAYIRALPAKKPKPAKVASKKK